MSAAPREGLFVAPAGCRGTGHEAMNAKPTAAQKRKFESDFTALLTFSLIANAKRLDKKQLATVKQCMGKKQISRALKIIQRCYGPRQWREYVEAQAAPLLKGY